MNRFAVWHGRRFLMVAAMVFGAAGCLSCAKASSQVVTDAAEITTTVPVAIAARHDIGTDLSITAEFEPYQEIDVMAKVSGYVRQVNVDVGDRVREGQILATMDIPEMQDELAKAAALVQQADAELAAATSESTRAESAHELTHLSYDRIKKVADAEPGLIPRQDLDDVRVRDQVAEAQMSSARSAREATDQKTRASRAEEARLRTMDRYATITAPFDGVVTRRYANVGTMIQPGSAQAAAVIRLAEQKRLRLILPVPEVAVPSLTLKDPVTVRVPALDRAFPGTVARFTDRIQQNTRTMDTQVDVDNHDFVLVPGMYAEVSVTTAHRAGAITIPLDAIERTETAAQVYLLTPTNAVHVAAVTLGIETANEAEVRSGVAAGDRVIVGRHTDLREGELVQAKLLTSSGGQ